MLERIPNAFFLGECVGECNYRGASLCHGGVESAEECTELFLIILVRIRWRGYKAKIVRICPWIWFEHKLFELDERFVKSMKDGRNCCKFVRFLKNSYNRKNDHFLKQELVVEDKVEGSDKAEESRIEHKQIFADIHLRYCLQIY